LISTRRVQYEALLRGLVLKILLNASDSFKKTTFIEFQNDFGSCGLGNKHSSDE
jgi:hypothetical protein